MKEKRNSIPVTVGDTQEISVTGMASSGDGILSLNGYTIFVPGCVPGDKIIGRVVKTTPNFGVCATEKVLSPSSARTTPFCCYYEDCGGCQLQHINYQQQIDFKSEVVHDALERIGGISTPVPLTVVPCSPPFSYRSRGIFAIGKSNEHVRIGFYKKKSHDIIDIENCPVLLKPINLILKEVRELIQREAIPIYDEDSHEGVLRRLVIRGSMSKNQFLVGLVTNGGRIPRDTVEQFARINSSLPKNIKITGVVQNINTQKGNIILGKKSRTLWGAPFFPDRVGELEYLLSITSFFQVNPIQMEVLNETVLKFLEGTDERILDAYCGNGSISLWLAKAGKEVTGVEENQNAITDAINSAKKNRLKNCSFTCTTVEKFLGDQNNTHYKALILNPPRGGCSGSVLNSVIESSPEKIVYVSCKPSTLARDLKKLCSNGYDFTKISVIDMFPQTVHMETVVLLKKIFAP